MSFLKQRIALLCLFTALGASCGSCKGDENNGDGGDVSIPDGGDGPDAGNNGTPDADNNGVDPDGGVDPDMGVDPTENVIACANTIAPAASGLCDATAGTNGFVLFQTGQVLAGDDIYENGTVLVDASNGNDEIVCVGCDCADTPDAAAATVVSCAEGVLSPSLINPHDHITFSLSWPQPHGTERYEHRHDWRRGLRGHNDIGTSPGSDDSREGVLYGETRMLFGGATSVAGSSSRTNSQGLLRNLDSADHLEGLTGIDVDYRTFPLGDASGALRDSDCSYPNIDSQSRAQNAGIYLPHVAEGIDEEANNEFKCLSTDANGGIDAIAANTSIIHGIGLTATDIAELGAEGGKLVWSPRSNIDLYGNTARVPVFKRYGVTIALGTDWSASGSMNVLRELQCADYLNTNHYNNTFTNRELWQMATYNAAIAMGADDQIGVIRERHVADLAIFDGSENSSYRAVIDAGTEDVHFVMRGGVPLYGDANIIEAIVPADEVTGCEALDVCGEARRLCIERDAGLTLAGLRSSVDQNAYPLFFCGEPDREPSCVPFRENEYDGSTTAGDSDGDGIPDAEDSCSDYFNPVRPLDMMMQPDVDGDGDGDECDECPTGDVNSCPMFDPNDRDLDGVPNLEDNCPDVANTDQADAEGDGIGDLCDACSDFDNSMNAACPATVYDIRTGIWPIGSQVFIEEVVVTAASDRAFFVQVPATASNYAGLANSGLYVFTGSGGPTPPNVGDIVSVSGLIDVFGDTLELVVSSFTVESSGNPLPDFTLVDPAEIATGGTRAAELEGTLVRVRDVVVTDANPDGPVDDYNEFAVTGDLRVDDLLYLVTPDPMVGDEFAILQGVVTFSFGNSKLLPRNTSDVITGPPGFAGLSPTMVYLEANTTGMTAPPLTVQLTGPALGDAVVNLAYTGSVSGPATITIPDGQDSATLSLTAAAAGAGTVTASYDGTDSVATVSIYDDASVRTVSGLSPSMANVILGGTTSLTVSIAPPAKAAGEVVTLTYAPGTNVSGPATVTVPAGAVSATFDVTGGPAGGTETVTASIGLSSQTATVTVVTSAANCLIVSEYIEGTGSNNKAFELFNCSPGTLDLSNFGICLVTNAATNCTSTTDLPAVQLAAGAVHTVCKTASGAAGDPVDGIANNCSQEVGNTANFNGNDRIVVFEDKNGNSAFDAADEVTDAFGQIATPPAMDWKDVTHRRCDFTQYDGVEPFDVNDRFTAHATNDAADYGTAPMSGCP